MYVKILDRYMEKKDFKIGDVVILKSGSPKFVVSELPDDEGIVQLIFWIEGNIDQSKAYINYQLLKKSTEED